jgi:hypothetical protein
MGGSLVAARGRNRPSRLADTSTVPPSQSGNPAWTCGPRNRRPSLATVGYQAAPTSIATPHSTKAITRRSSVQPARDAPRWILRQTRFRASHEERSMIVPTRATARFNSRSGTGTEPPSVNWATAWPIDNRFGVRRPTKHARRTPDCVLLTQGIGFLARTVVSPNLLPSSAWLGRVLECCATRRTLTRAYRPCTLGYNPPLSYMRPPCPNLRRMVGATMSPAMFKSARPSLPTATWIPITHRA